MGLVDEVNGLYLLRNKHASIGLQSANFTSTPFGMAERTKTKQA